MSRASRVVFFALLLGAFVVSACGDPPEKEMQQAQGAIDAARAAGADRYAPEELGAAQEALTHAREAVDQRDYRLALNHALDSRERALNAAKAAADNKAATRLEADRALNDAATALRDAQRALQTVERTRVSPLAIAEPRRVIADADRSLQEARAAFDAGDYLVVPTVVVGVVARLGAATSALDAASSAPPPRRRR
jgi:hypothetical protein